jgi:periplasmic protein TonB
VDEPVAKPAPAAPAASIEIPAPARQPEKLPAPVAASPSFTAGLPSATSGAASAPAPARTPQQPSPEKPQPSADSLFEKPAEATPSPSPAIVGSAPSFTFGGANTEPESKGGNKKILLGAVAAVVIIAAAYVGWAQFHGHSTAPATTQVATQPAAVQPQPAKPASVPPTTPASKPAAATSTPSVAPENEPSSSATDDADSAPQEITLKSTRSSAKPSSPAPSKAVEEETPAAAPMVVKGGKVPVTQTKPAAADAPAPSLIGMAAPGAGAPPPNFVSGTNNAVKPVLQTLNISQGVSQGLVIKKVSPSYPSTALRMRTEGTVQLLATVSKDGDITHIKVLSGDPQLTKAATDAVKQWKYKPYLLNGEPVEIQTQITVNFKLPR